ncbi:MAG TPA: hypothetical protein VNC50_09160 [Planctomycetia bacterium]|nr:hypothetical protein [Planctomycetia bacterium]
MKALLVLIVLLAVVAGVGFNQGWFGAEAKKDPIGKGGSVTVKVDGDKFEKDKAEFKAAADAKLKDLDEEIDKLKDKAKKASADVKEKYSEEAAKLEVKKDALKKDLEELKTSTAEKWDDFKKRFGAAYDDVKKGAGDAASRFK